MIYKATELIFGAGGLTNEGQGVPRGLHGHKNKNCQVEFTFPTSNLRNPMGPREWNPIGTTWNPMGPREAKCVNDSSTIPAMSLPGIINWISSFVFQMDLWGSKPTWEEMCEPPMIFQPPFLLKHKLKTTLLCYSTILVCLHGKSNPFITHNLPQIN